MLYEQHPPSSEGLERLWADRNPTMICGLLLLLSSIAYHVTSTLIDLNHTTTTNALNRIIPHCFTPEGTPDLGETNLKDCRDALLILARNPDFTTPIPFSKNPRRGVILPQGWTSGECLILMSCENDRDAYTVRFADVLVEARRLVDECVGTKEDERWGLLRWGGIATLKGTETFYVSVGSPPTPLNPVGSVMPVELVNGTLLDLATEVS